MIKNTFMFNFLLKNSEKFMFNVWKNVKTKSLVRKFVYFKNYKFEFCGV